MGIRILSHSSAGSIPDQMWGQRSRLKSNHPQGGLQVGFVDMPTGHSGQIKRVQASHAGNRELAWEGVMMKIGNIVNREGT